ncbi:ADAMTS-like protein 1 isoform X2 [Limulus polyphemus]|uniref:ADAMTS-like protein 1 isoform X2 n=1 Tax=Limulus polyphemus TaxID=6850 RepID=A0ABM1TSN5_LIMPO|nr:ADAMTS-like protein 1 isoform X2 [Limulus polyphemus]
MSRPICRNQATGREVSEGLCDPTIRPRPQIRMCNNHQCPAVWITESWGSCSVSCGGGHQTRLVYCARGGPNGTRARISDFLCSKKKPVGHRRCNTQSCPRWIEDPWSGCSVTCGHGVQTRNVVCRDHSGHVSKECDYRLMPATEQDCSSGISCPISEQSVPKIHAQEDAPPEHFYPLLWTQQSVGPAELSGDPWFEVSDWEPCSVTCGEGTRRRIVECKIFLEFSRSVATLPDRECPGPQPANLEKCFPRPCSLDQNKDELKNNVDDKNIQPGPFYDTKFVTSPDLKPTNKEGGKMGIEVTYSWRKAGFTPCSASCLGGIQETIIQCVRDHDQAIVSPYLCDISKKPGAITQTCNDHACPPRWNVSDFSVCSKSCAGGLQTRTVQCIHEVTRGAANTLIVANNLCPQPPPRVQQLCNVNDCPTRWRVEQYSKCSQRCGGGIKTRKVKCEKELAFGRIVSQPTSMCPKKRPRSEKPCKVKPCGSDTGKTPYIKTSDQNYVQKNPTKKLKLSIGGHAVLFEDTSVKIRCPTRNFNKSLIVWYKDKIRIEKSRKFKISRRGSLRIRHLTSDDNGKYSCAAGPAKANITLLVKPIPPGYGRSDEDKTVERPDFDLDCNNAVCLDGNSRISSIESNKFIQQNPKQNVHLKTGGYASLFDGTKLKLRCINQPKGNALIEWYKDKNKLQSNKKYTITSTGKLKVKELTKEDSGRYTCLVGPMKSDIFVSVKSSPPGYGRFDEDKTVERPFFPLGEQLGNVEDANYSHEDRDDALKGNEHYNHNFFSNRPRFHKPGLKQTNREKSKTRQRGKFRPTNPLRSKTHIFASNPSPADDMPHPKVLDTWEYQHGSALFSDQEKDDLNAGTPHGGQGIPDSPQEEEGDQLRSGAASNHALPHLQQLLVNLRQTLRGDYNGFPIDHAEEEPTTPEMISPVGPLANSVFLGKGNPESLKFDWDVTEWSVCSHTCGGNGYQVRVSQCVVRLNNVSRSVENNICADSGLDPPLTIQKCGLEECPHWETGAWSECSESTCFTWNTAYQKRDIFCRLPNETEVDGVRCEERTRPRRRRECYNDQCRGVWKVGDWSECTATCGDGGFRSRILQCVWFGTKEVAGNACRDQPRPSVVQKCTGPPCTSSIQCVDLSQYCGLAKTLNMCRMSHYREQCCKTCLRR